MRISFSSDHILRTFMACGCLFFSACASLRQTDTQKLRLLPPSFLKPVDVAGTVDADRLFFTDTCLRELIDSALAHNQNLKASVARITIARSRLYIAGANAMPAAGLSISAAADRYADYTMNGIGNFDTNLSPNVDDDHKIPVSPTTDLFLGLRSNWEIDLWGKLKDRRRAAGQRAGATVFASRWLATQVTAEVARLYFRLQALDAQHSVLEDNLSLQVAALEMVNAQVGAGRSTALATHRFEARLRHTESDIHAINQEIIRCESELNMLLGRYEGVIPRIHPNALMPDLAADAGIPAELLLHRPDILEAEATLAATKLDVSAARKAFFPSLRLNAYAGLNSFKGFQLFLPGSLAYGLMGGLTAPLLNQRMLKGNKRIADANQEQAFYQYQQKVIEAYREVFTAIKKIDNYKEAYRSKQREVRSLDTAVSVAGELYRNGYANYLEVIDAQRNVLSASLEAAALKREIYTGLVDLYRATGGG